MRNLDGRVMGQGIVAERPRLPTSCVAYSVWAETLGVTQDGNAYPDFVG